MTTVKLKSKKGTDLFIPVLDSEMESALLDGNQGLCIACGAEANGVEPDARHYECESCGMKKVFGLEELILMGMVASLVRVVCQNTLNTE